MRRSAFLAREERGERSGGFLGGQAFAEQRAFFLDAAHHIRRRHLQQLARQRDGLGGKGADLARDLAGFILGMAEAVGLTVLHAYGDITYLMIFVGLMIFLAIRPNGLMGKPWG